MLDTKSAHAFFCNIALLRIDMYFRWSVQRLVILFAGLEDGEEDERRGVLCQRQQQDNVHVGEFCSVSIEPINKRESVIVVLHVCLCNTWQHLPVLGVEDKN